MAEIDYGTFVFELKISKCFLFFKIVKFGSLGTKIPPSGKMSQVLGTQTYMAPEVCERNYDERIDLWSVGVCLYAMLRTRFKSNHLMCDSSNRICHFFFLTQFVI